MPNHKILNIGAGKKIMPGAVNIDILKLPGIDKVCDITKGLPYKGETFSKVVAEYVLCQICSPQTFRFVMNEIWRVLQKGGWLELKVPNANYPAAWQDPMDCRRFTPETFDYFNREHYRWYAFEYGFKPWHNIVIEPERGDRLYVKMQKYAE